MALMREAEPELVMETPEAVDEFHRAGAPGGPLFASYHVLATHLSRTLPEASTVVDLFCGSGRLLATLLAGRRDLRGIGVDLSARMLGVAATSLADAGVADRAELVRADAAAVDDAVAGPVSAIVSMSALHHCPTGDDLAAVMEAVARVHRRDGAAVWLFDLVRPDEEALIERIPRSYELVSQARLPPAFRADWKTSLRAGWTVEELAGAVRAAEMDVTSTSGDYSQLHRVEATAPASGPPWEGPPHSEADQRRIDRLAAALGLTDT